MSQQCELIHKNFNTKNTYDVATNLFLPYNADLCAAVAPWPFAMARNFTTSYASPASRGARVAEFLEYVLHKYVWLQPPDCAKIRFLIQRAHLGLTPMQAVVLIELAGPRGAIGYQGPEARRLSFSQDFSWNYQLAAEQYWFGCNLTLTKGDVLPTSFVFIISRHSVTPQPFWQNRGGALNSVLLIQYMLTIPSQNKFISKTVSVDGAWAVDSAQTNPFFVGAGDAFGIKSISNSDQIFPLQVWCIDPSNAVSVKMEITNTKPFLHSDFMWPRIDVVSGSVAVGSDFRQLIEDGTGVLGHPHTSEQSKNHIVPGFFPRALSNVRNRFRSGEIGPQNWFFIQLKDGTELMGRFPGNAFAVMTKYPVSNILVIDPDGGLEYYDGEVLFERTFESPLTGTRYFDGLRVYVPSVRLEFQLEPTSTEALNRSISGTEYYTAGVKVSGSRLGVGFVEALHYETQDNFVRRLLRELNFANVDELVPYFLTSKTPLGTYLASLLVFLWPVVLVLFFIVLVIFLVRKKKLS